MRAGLLGAFLAMGAVNYLCRAFFTVLVPRHGVGPFWERFLSAIPLSILTALAAPAVLAPLLPALAGAAPAAGDPALARLLSALLTVAVARIWGNLLLSVGAGTALFALLTRAGSG